MAGTLRGVYLIGDKAKKLVTAVLVQDLPSGGTSTLSLEDYVHRGLEPADGTLPWQEDVEMKPAEPHSMRGLGWQIVFASIVLAAIFAAMSFWILGVPLYVAEIIAAVVFPVAFCFFFAALKDWI